jgi:hypothetical protein
MLWSTNKVTQPRVYFICIGFISFNNIKYYVHANKWYFTAECGGDKSRYHSLLRRGVSLEPTLNYITANIILSWVTDGALHHD